MGAILVQNTNWKNTERAITNLRREKVLDVRRLSGLPLERLKALIRPAGYFNVKALRLKNFLDFLTQHAGGDIKGLAGLPWPVARARLLSVNGIGHETADSILLYALGKPVFVVDAYTRRMLLHHGFHAESRDYASMQKLFMRHIAPDTAVYNEYHALIVRLGKQFRPGEYGAEDYPLKDRKYFL